MSSKIGPRSVKDATRFTSTIPHAASKTASAGPSAASRAATPASAARLPGETPEQRVRRLRLAHLAAQKAQVSQTEKFIDGSRRFLDAAHRFTVKGIVLFTVVATVVSIYSVWDMLQYNKARRAEWLEAQIRLEDDELAVARVAYLKGEATEDQILLVEEANRHAEAQGIKLPPLLGAPEHRTHFEENIMPALEGQGEEQQSKGILGMFGGLLGGKKESSDMKVITLPKSPVADQTTPLQGKAQQAWEQEKNNQRKGGSLDQLGIEASAPTPSKKGWWPW